MLLRKKKEKKDVKHRKQLCMNGASVARQRAPPSRIQFLRECYITAEGRREGRGGERSKKSKGKTK